MKLKKVQLSLKITNIYTHTTVQQIGLTNICC